MCDKKEVSSLYVPPMDKAEIIERLHSTGASCVIYNKGEIYSFYSKGVVDLYKLLTEHPELLSGAFVADKVIGKGAAALMALGKVASVYADVVSRPALSLLEYYAIKVEYGVVTDNIINRRGDGICPVEALTSPYSSAEECFKPIAEFIKKMKQ